MMKGECLLPAQKRKTGDTLTMRERDRQQETPEQRHNEHAEGESAETGESKKEKHGARGKARN